MSIVPLSSAPQYPSKYHVRANHCDCHPETCCCNDWAVFNKDGTKEITTYTKKEAERLADLFNKEAGN